MLKFNIDVKHQAAYIVDKPVTTDSPCFPLKMHGNELSAWLSEFSYIAPDKKG